LVNGAFVVEEVENGVLEVLNNVCLGYSPISLTACTLFSFFKEIKMHNILVMNSWI